MPLHCHVIRCRSRNSAPPFCADLASGLFVQRQTDLYVEDVLPLAVTRTYRPGDYNRRAFGVGMSLPYSTALHSTNQYQVVDLIMPDGGLVHYTRIIDPANPTDNNWVTAHFITDTPGVFYRSHMEYNGNGWNLTRTDGVMLVFGDKRRRNGERRLRPIPLSLLTKPGVNGACRAYPDRE